MHNVHHRWERIKSEKCRANNNERWLTWQETNTCNGPTIAKKPICKNSQSSGQVKQTDYKRLALLTLTTLASTTSPLKGFMTMAVYLVLNFAWPVDGIIFPSPMSVMVMTEMIYLASMSASDLCKEWIREYIPMFTATRSFNIFIKLLTKIVFELSAKVGWMK